MQCQWSTEAGSHASINRAVTGSHGNGDKYLVKTGYKMEDRNMSIPRGKTGSKKLVSKWASLNVKGISHKCGASKI